MPDTDTKTLIRPVLSETLGWFQLAVPEPAAKNFTTQLGCHFEEVREMVHELNPLNPQAADLLLAADYALHALAEFLKTNEGSVAIKNRVEYLDAICDQLVTATGCAHMAKLDVIGGLNEVNRSNFSKFHNGVPQFDENRKLSKGPAYTKSDLTPFV
jgi:hypothetical protein